MSSFNNAKEKSEYFDFEFMLATKAFLYCTTFDLNFCFIWCVSLSEGLLKFNVKHFLKDNVIIKCLLLKQQKSHFFGPNMNNTESTLKIHAGFTCAQSAEVRTSW